MDAGLIFLICFGVVFGSLLIGGWRFGHPLLIRYAKRKSLQRPSVENLQTGVETAQGGQESAVTSRKTRNLNWASWRHRSAPSASDDQSSPSPRASPASSLLSTISQTISSCSSHKITGLDIIMEPHDLYNMVAVPPVPKQGLSRRAAEIGTQAPPAALLARRSQDTLKSTRSALSVASVSSSYYGDTDSLRVVTSTPLTPTRTRTASGSGTPSPLRQVYRPESPIDPVPPIPAHLITATEPDKCPISQSKPLPSMPFATNKSEDAAPVGDPNQEQIGAAEIKVNAANAAIRIPSKIQHAGLDEYYEVQGLFSISPSLKKSPPPKVDPFKTPPPQSSLNPKTSSASMSFTDSLKKFTRRAKATPTDEEASHSIKITISGPSSYVPNIGSGWSPNEYLTLHNAKQIENPLIEHPAIGPQQFRKVEDRHEDDGEDTSMMISHKMRKLDSYYGYKRPRKIRNARSPPPIPGEQL